MSNKPLTKQQKLHISQGMRRFLQTPKGRARVEAMKGKPWGREWADGNTPWNTGTEGVVKISATAKRKISRANSKPVFQFEMWTLKFIKEWPSGMKAAQALGLNPRCISQCCNRRIKSSGGFRWAFSRDTFNRDTFNWDYFRKE